MAGPMLLFDGDCAFCQAAARFARRLGAEAVIVSYQHAELEPLGLTPDECAEALCYVDAGSRKYRGHHAVAAFLGSSARPWRYLRLPLLLPGTDRLWTWLYNLVARNRARLPGGSAQCDVPTRPPGE